MSLEETDSQQFFQNPVIAGFHPDPSICRVDRDYWLATSSFEYFPGIPLFHSRDLVNWRLVGHAIDRQEQLSLINCVNSKGIFAPTIRFHEGLFYLVSTMVGGAGNFILTARQPEGPWSDPIWIEEDGLDPWFDPSLFFDAGGNVYYTRRHGMEIWQASIDVASGKLLQPLQSIAQPMASDDIEGPHLYRIGEYYYLLAAEGGTGWGHAITVARSSTPDGPFLPCPHNPLLTHRHLPNHSIRSTGHGDLIEAHDGSWWIVFLGTRHGHFGGSPFHHLGRETFLAPVNWRDGWPIINDGRPVGRFTRAPGFFGGIQNEPGKHYDDFDSPVLGPEWTFRRSPLVRSWTLTERPGWLRLWGQRGTLDDKETEAFVGRRLDCPEFRATILLDHESATEGTAAGLALLLADDCHAELMVTRTADGHRLALTQRALTLRQTLWTESLREGPWTLQVDGNWSGFIFSVIENNGRTITGPWIDRRLLCTELATGWTGLFIGLYATAINPGQGGPADFTAFRYDRQAITADSQERIREAEAEVLSQPR